MAKKYLQWQFTTSSRSSKNIVISRKLSEIDLQSHGVTPCRKASAQQALRVHLPGPFRWSRTIPPPKRGGSFTWSPVTMVRPGWQGLTLGGQPTVTPPSPAPVPRWSRVAAVALWARLRRRALATSAAMRGMEVERMALACSLSVPDCRRELMLGGYGPIVHADVITVTRRAIWDP